MVLYGCVSVQGRVVSGLPALIKPDAATFHHASANHPVVCPHLQILLAVVVFKIPCVLEQLILLCGPFVGKGGNGLCDAVGVPLIQQGFLVFEPSPGL